MKRPELLSPAGNPEKLRAAVAYGADAVYLAGNRFGMRSAADNFTVPGIFEAAEYLHARGKRLYLTVNTMPHADEYPALREFLTSLRGAGVDACIVADLGVMALVKELLPEAELHVSTQSGVVSAESARMYGALGATRVVPARELTLEELAIMRRELPDMELETFVHGSMCVSYSGRCMLSHFLTGRDANRGACTQPCRWGYHLIEEKRPALPLPIEENDLGTFIMSSRDMNTIEILPQLIAAGIDSFKIEGRMKSAYYTAVVTNAYRMAIDSYLADPEGYVFDSALARELESVSHREYSTGYYLGLPHDEAQLCTRDGYIREKAYFATAEDRELPEALADRTDVYPFVQRNKVKVGDGAEIISPGRVGRGFSVTELYDEQGTPVEAAPHPGQKFFCQVPFEVKPGDIMRGN